MRSLSFFRFMANLGPIWKPDFRRNVRCVLICRNFDFLGGYCLLPSGYYWLLLTGYLVVTSHYWWLLLVPTFSMNEVKSKTGKRNKLVHRDKQDKNLIYNSQHSFVKFKDISGFKEFALDSVHKN